MGGGVILEAAREKFRAVKAVQIVSYLQAVERGDVRGVVQGCLARNRFHPLSPAELQRETGLDRGQIVAEIKACVSGGTVLEIDGKGFVAKERLEVLKERAEAAVREFFAQYPLAEDIKPLEIKGRLAPAMDDGMLQRIIEELVDEGRIIPNGSGYRPPAFRVKLLPEQQKLAALLLRYARDSGLVPFGAGKFCKFNTRIRTFSQSEIQKILDLSLIHI